MVSYAQDAIDAVHAELPGLDPDLARCFALLALTPGIAVELADVHHAWALHVLTTRPGDPAPFVELRPEVRRMYQLYADGIRRAARRITSNRLHGNRHLKGARRATVASQLRTLYESGECLADLAALTGFSRSLVRTLLIEAGTTLRPPRGDEGFQQPPPPATRDLAERRSRTVGP